MTKHSPRRAALAAVVLACMAASILAGCASFRLYEQELEKGDLALTLGESENAGRHFRSALAQRPGDPEALYGLARALIASGDAEAALEVFAGIEYGNVDYFNRYCRVDHPLALRQAAESRLQRGDSAGGLRLARRLHQLDPESQGLQDLLPRALVAEGDRRLAAGHIRDAEALYREALLEAPQRVEAVIGLANALIEGGRVDEAIMILSDASLTHPEDERLDALMDRAIEIRYPISPAKAAPR